MSKEIIITKVAKRAGISPEAIMKALESGSEDGLTFDVEGEFISNDDLETIKVKSQKTGHAEGFDAGKEVLIKEIKNEQKLEFVEKTKENLINGLKAKYQKEFGTEPNKHIQDLEKDIESLQGKLDVSEDNLKKETEKYNSKINGLTIEQEIKSKLPEKLANGLTRDDAYMLYMAKNKIEKQDGKTVLIDPETNQVMKDKRLTPVTVDDHIKNFIDSFGKVNETGRTGKDEIGKTKTNIEGLLKGSDVAAYFEKNNTLVSEQSGILAKAMKNEGFDTNA